MTSPNPLSVTVDTDHADSGTDPSVKRHQLDHDALHAAFWTPKVVAFIADTRTLTNMAAAETAVLGTQSNIRIDLTGAREVRLTVAVGATVGAPGSKLYAQYDAESTPVNIANLEVLIDSSLPAFTVRTSVWVPLPAAARTDKVWRIAGSGGDGVADPGFGNVFLHYR